jgi:hypothetical protein
LVEIAIVPVPPPAEKDAGVADAVTAHLTVEGEVTFWVDEAHAPAPAAIRQQSDASTLRRTVVINAPAMHPLGANRAERYKEHSVPPHIHWLLISYRCVVVEPLAS